MVALRSSLIFVAFCCALVLGFHEDHRTVESFSPAVHHVHLHDIADGGARTLGFVPTVPLGDDVAVALNLAEQILGFPVTYKVKSTYETDHNKIRHAYLKQTADDGREIFNADLNINVLNNEVLSLGHSFYRGSTAAVAGSLSSLEAVQKLGAFLQLPPMKPGTGVRFQTQPKGLELEHTIKGVRGARTQPKIRAGYLQVENGKRLEPVWDIELDMDLHWWSAQVSMVTGEVLALHDWVHDVNSFNIFPPSVNDPSDGERTIVFGPAKATPSPIGWNDQGKGILYNTSGNNVYAQTNPTGSTTGWLTNPRPSGGTANDYNYPINFAIQPGNYSNASCTNLFAWNNYIHDIFYGYGFDEKSGNFQENNFGKGGLGGDAVQANCQDGAGLNNANFATPVDGQRPRMRMYLWNASYPWRDGDFDNGIIIHEYAHGISTRLTGGPSNSNCLGSGEAGGMGEGWGDFFANVIRQRPTYNRNTIFPMGNYSSNKPLGIRKYPYTTDMKIDPETYAFINGANYTGVHAKGEVWCGILWDVYWNFVEKYGFSTDLYYGEGGNNMILRNVVDGLKLQPCNPNFVSARDAIFLADKANYNNANFCLMWKGFAKRGLGLNAVGGRTGAPTVKEDFSIPVECQTN